MRERLKKAGAYIFRGWDEEAGYAHPLMKILPPFSGSYYPYKIRQ
jgi:hypothetical protein